MFLFHYLNETVLSVSIEEVCFVPSQTKFNCRACLQVIKQTLQRIHAPTLAKYLVRFWTRKFLIQNGSFYNWFWGMFQECFLIRLLDGYQKIEFFYLHSLSREKNFFKPSGTFKNRQVNNSTSTISLMKFITTGFTDEACNSINWFRQLLRRDNFVLHVRCTVPSRILSCWLFMITIQCRVSLLLFGRGELRGFSSSDHATVVLAFQHIILRGYQERQGSSIKNTYAG